MVGYLVCDKCDNYYKLQPDELPEDLMINVIVGGYLKFKTHMKGVNEDVPIQTQQTYGSRLSYRDRRDIFAIIAFLVVKVVAKCVSFFLALHHIIFHLPG